MHSVWQQYGAGVMAAVLCAGIWAGLDWVTALEDEYECEVLDGYNPSGETHDEAYPPDTWAGTCQRTETGAVTFRAVLLAIGLAVPGAILAKMMRDILL